MSNGYVNNKSMVPDTGIVCPESATTVLTQFRISDRDSLHFQAYVTVSDTTLTTAITLKLQDSPDNGTTWRDIDSASITADGSYQVENLLFATYTYVMWPQARLVIVTGATDTTTVDSVYITRRL